MVYSRGARGGVESVRRAFRLLGVRDIRTGRRLVRRAAVGSRLAESVRSLPEARSDSGFADAFLHPTVHTFSIDELMAMVAGSSMQPLLFAHPGALPDVEAEVARLRKAEAEGDVYFNYILYLGKNCMGGAPPVAGNRLLLNPALRSAVGVRRIVPVRIDARLGSANPVLGWGERRFLRQFVTPVEVSGLDDAEVRKAEEYLRRLFLFCVG